MMTDEALIRFRFVGNDAQALLELPVQELRRPRDQVGRILHQELAQWPQP